MMDAETLRAMLGWGTATRALLADIAAAIREHTAEMRESEARIEARVDKRATEDHSASDARQEPFRTAMQGLLEHMAELEANAERRQIESEDRADQRFAAMEKRMHDRGY